MQIPADPLDAAALKAALLPGQRQYFRHELLIDWDRDGTWDHAYSDLSSAVTSAKLQQELTDSTPGSNVVASGASAAQLDVTMQGSVLAGGQWMTIHDLLAPYNTASPLYRVTSDELPIRYRMSTSTARGWITTDQCTAWIDERGVRRVGNQVTFTAINVPPSLRSPVRWVPWAVDGPAAARLKSYAPQRGLASSVVDYVLNAAGVRTRPRPPWESASGVAALCWLPLCGSFAPARGRQISQYPWGNFQLFPEVYPISPGLHPAGTYWVDGPFGLARHGEQNVYPGALIYTTSDQQPTWTGFSTSISAWVYCGPTAPGYDATPSATLRPPVAQVHFGYSTAAGNYYAFRLSIASAGPTVQVQLENGVSSTLRYGTYTPGSDGWRHVHAQLDHNTGSVVRCKLIVDGVDQVNFTGSGGSTIAATPLNVLFLPQVGFHLRPGVRMSDAMAWQETGAPAVVPERTVTAGAVVERSLNEITHLPPIGDNPPAPWDVAKEIAAAEFGAVVIDEQGLVHWHNRETVRTTQDPQTITLDYPSDVGTTSSDDGRANTVYVSAAPGEATWQKAWETPSVDYIIGVPGVSTWVVPLDADVIAIESGTVPRLYQSAESASVLPVWSGSVAHGYVFVYDSTEIETADQNMVLLTDQAGIGDRQLAKIQVTNLDTRTGRFRLKSDLTNGTDPQPALRIAGLILARAPAETGTVTSAANVLADGQVKAISLTGGDWRQHLDSVKASAVFALRRATQPIPVFGRFQVIADPRRQLADRVTLLLGTSGPRVKAVVVGSTRTLDQAGLREDLTIRATHAPGRWALGDTVLGRLESTAVVG